MSKLLKDQFGPTIPAKIADSIRSVWTPFPSEAFLRDALVDYEPLGLMARGAKIATSLKSHLPLKYECALEILMQSLGPKLEKEGYGPSPFYYLPHTTFVASYGLGHFEASMRAQYELTQRFTAEFSIRPFLEQHPELTLRRMAHWTEDSNVHVRRLVSEGTRPRLPWAARLRAFQKDPLPVLALLERLKDDPELYVRRSVANNLNDIGKDHPGLLVETASRWLKGASRGRAWIVKHALRTAVKRGDVSALEVLGYKKGTRVEVENATLSPASVCVGGNVTLSFEVVNNGRDTERVVVDFQIQFVKANGKRSAKVFKLRAIELAAGSSVRLNKKVSLAEMTTRKHYPGTHVVEVLLNGAVQSAGSFELRSAGSQRCGF